MTRAGSPVWAVSRPRICSAEYFQDLFGGLGFDFGAESLFERLFGAARTHPGCQYRAKPRGAAQSNRYRRRRTLKQNRIRLGDLPEPLFGARLLVAVGMIPERKHTEGVSNRPRVGVARKAQHFAIVTSPVRNGFFPAASDLERSEANAASHPATALRTGVRAPSRLDSHFGLGLQHFFEERTHGIRVGRVLIRPLSASQSPTRTGISVPARRIPPYSLEGHNLQIFWLLGRNARLALWRGLSAHGHRHEGSNGRFRCVKPKQKACDAAPMPPLFEAWRSTAAHLLHYFRSSTFDADAGSTPLKDLPAQRG
jgi:hypothetical protein